MKIRSFALAFAFMSIAAVCYGQNDASKQAPTSVGSRFTGVWRGELNNLPGIVVVITDEGGGLSGAVLFYLQMRPDENHPWTATAGIPEPMLDPKLVGGTLKFQVSHRRAHPPRTLSDLPFPFHLSLTGPNKAVLLNEKEGPPVEMIRSDY